MTQDMMNIRYGNSKRIAWRLFSFAATCRFSILVLLMTVLGVNNVWGATVTYHIINLGRLDDSGQLTTSTRTEALQFYVTANTVTVGNSTLEKYKSPLAKNWKYYSSSDVSYNTSTKVCTFTGGPSLDESSVLSANADVYVTYELDEDALSTAGLENGGIYRIKFPNNFYLQQSTWYNNTTKQTEINTSSSAISNTTTNDYLWKFNIVDPYQITIQSQSDDYTNYYLSNKTGNTSFADIRLQPTLAAAKGTYSWAFSLLPGGSDGTYRLIVTDGSTVNQTNDNRLDSFGHGYLNNNRKGNKTTYHLYNQTTSSQGEVANTPYARCDLTIEIFKAKYTFHIINNSNEEAMKDKTASALNAGDAITAEMIPDLLKSPVCNYSFYPTEADAIAGTHELMSLPYSSANIYVRYNTSSSAIYFNGTIRYNLSVGGDHYLYAADATSIGSATTSGADDTYKWTLHGDDPYQFTIKNVDNSQYITYDVSGGEAAPTLSGTGSYFFLHQSTSGKYELVAIPSNNYPTSYYTLGYSTDGLKLYSNTSYSFGADEIQTVFTASSVAVINPLPTANNRTYDGTTQNLVTAGVCEHGTVWYREGTEGDYATTIPTKKDAGTYHVYYKSVGDTGYDGLIVTDPIIVTIAPAPVTVTAENKSKVYGESDPTLTATITGLISGESESLITYTLSRATGQDVGNYTITPAGAALQGNYAVSFETGELTISKKTVGITWGETSLPYNGTPQAPTATATGLVNSDIIGITVTGAKTNVGTYTATASGLTGTKKGNYQLPTTKTTTFSIVKGSINTSIVMTEWSYGDYDPTTNSPSLSFNPDNQTVNYRYKVKGANDETYDAAVPTEVGTYTVQASMGEGDNSLAQILTKDFTISKKALNKDDAGTPADGITITVTKNMETNPPSYNVTVTHNIQGTPTPLTQFVDAEHDYDYEVSGSQSVSGHVVTVTAKNNNGIYTGNYTGLAKAAYAEPTFYLDGATWSPSGDEYAAVYLGIYDVVPSPVASGSEIKAYIVNKVNPTIGTVTVSPVEYTIDDTNNPPIKENYIPKGVPVLLLSNNENLTGFTTSPTTETTTDITAAAENSNLLRIAPADGVPVKDTEAYIFYEGEFVLAKEGTIKKDYFYFYNPNYQAQSEPGGGSAPAPRRSLQIVVQDTETGISRIVRDENREVQNVVWYTLDGRRLMNRPTQKGIYITNGKKVIIR
jgi:hypothetical protein